MFKFLPGIILIQLTTVALVLTSTSELNNWESWLRLLIPLAVIGITISFWFSSLSKQSYKDGLARIKARFAKEREQLRINAEQDKTKIVKQSQKEIAQEAKRTHTKANFKVGASFAGAAAVGAIMLLTTFSMFGMVILTTAGGALGGYFYRAKKGPIKAFPKVKNAAAFRRKKEPKLIEQPPEKS